PGIARAIDQKLERLAAPFVCRRQCRLPLDPYSVTLHERHQHRSKIIEAGVAERLHAKLESLDLRRLHALDILLGDPFSPNLATDGVTVLTETTTRRLSLFGTS